MEWKILDQEKQLKEIRESSQYTPQLIFKHSTRCSVSHLIKNRLENASTQPELEFYYLDLLKHREISNKIAAEFDVHHESPQVILIKNGQCIYEESHHAIEMQEIMAQIQQL